MSVFAAWYSSVILVTGAVPPSPEAVALAEKKMLSTVYVVESHGEDRWTCRMPRT